MNISIAQESRKGGRPYNQDRLTYCRTSDALLLAIADGMGGHAGGEVAAQAAVESLGESFRAQAKPALPDPETFVSGAMARAHSAVLAKARQSGLGDEPRTTLVACVVQGGHAYWTFVGDSRLYIIREGKILMRTRDHTYVQQLVDAGRIREEAVLSHPERNKLLRCLGGSNTPPLREPVGQSPLAKGDIVLLCSDGLWGPLTPRLLVIGLLGKPPARALPELMSLAESRGGPGCDNISALAMQWQGAAAMAA